MSDVKVEYEQTINRDDAAALLSQLARAFSGGQEAEFPFGPSTVQLHVPGSVRVELEVEVEDGEVEVEIEFTWPLPQRSAGPPGALTPGAKVVTSRPPQRANGAGRPAHTVRAKRT